jgi:hypothetical protein
MDGVLAGDASRDADADVLPDAGLMGAWERHLGVGVSLDG